MKDLTPFLLFSPKTTTPYYPSLTNEGSSAQRIPTYFRRGLRGGMVSAWKLIGIRDGKIDGVDCKKPCLDATLETLVKQDLKYSRKIGPQ